jgi:hypothetical protein
VNGIFEGALIRAQGILRPLCPRCEDFGELDAACQIVESSHVMLGCFAQSRLW